MFLLNLALFIGCDPAQRYHLLSFFLDGVPDPNKPKVVSVSETKDSTGTTDSSIVVTKSEQKYSMHPPYADRSCATCHSSGGGNKLTEELPALCYNCHKNYSTATTYVHGPVAGGFCTACHEPHFGKAPKLLKRQGQDLCLYCHDNNDIIKKDVHQSIGDADCTSCHNPHGGEERSMMN